MRNKLIVDESVPQGYTEEKYYALSTQRSLPPRCPIFRDCCRAVWSRYVLKYSMAGAKISFNEFIKVEGQRWEPDVMIKEVEQLEWTVPGPNGLIYYSIYNCCPEVCLFEHIDLPDFPKRGCGNITVYLESKITEETPKHYSQCAEFSAYHYLNQPKEKKTKSTKRAPQSKTLRIEIFQSHDFKCYWCKKHKDDFPKGVHLEIDHVIPISAGGTDNFSNLVAACSECNRGKSNKIIVPITEADEGLQP